MPNQSFPIKNAAGKLFCMAVKAPDGRNIILQGKNCEISLFDLQTQATRRNKPVRRNTQPNK